MSLYNGYTEKSLIAYAKYCMERFSIPVPLLIQMDNQDEIEEQQDREDDFVPVYTITQEDLLEKQREYNETQIMGDYQPSVDRTTEIVKTAMNSWISSKRTRTNGFIKFCHSMKDDSNVFARLIILGDAPEGNMRINWLAELSGKRTKALNLIRNDQTTRERFSKYFRLH